MDIIDFKKQKFIRDCIEFLKTKEMSEELKKVINTATPGYLEYLKKGETSDTVKVIETAITKVRQLSQKEITSNRQKINIIALSVLEGLSTDDTRFQIKEVTDRYRESINPVKALYYDLQEIMFLYDGKKEQTSQIFDRKVF